MRSTLLKQGDGSRLAGKGGRWQRSWARRLSSLPSLKHLSRPPPLLFSLLVNEQATKTALADTPGSRFAAEANKLVEASRFDELVGLLSSQIDLICTAAPAKGERGRHAA